MPISQTVSIPTKKINKIFLELHYSLLRMPKIIEISWIVPAEKCDSKT